MLIKESYERASLSITEFKRDGIYTDTLAASSNISPLQDGMRIIALGTPYHVPGSMSGDR